MLSGTEAAEAIAVPLDMEPVAGGRPGWSEKAQTVVLLQRLDGDAGQPRELTKAGALFTSGMDSSHGLDPVPG